jgi:heme exporter protein A
MIEINNLSFARGNYLIFKDVSFSVNSGEIIIIRGPNGKGKTTLLSNIIQLLDPLSGEVKYQGIKIDSYIASQCFLFLGENHFAYDQLSLNQNIDYWLSIHNVTLNKTVRDQSIKYLFGELNLNKKFYQLSFGQKKKLQLLLLMLVNKPIWILDDPFNGLDNETIIKITTLLSKKVENNGTAIIASHHNVAIPHKTYELS